MGTENSHSKDEDNNLIKELGLTWVSGKCSKNKCNDVVVKKYRIIRKNIKDIVHASGKSED